MARLKFGYFIAPFHRAGTGTVIPEGTGCVNRVAGLWFCWLSASG